MEIRIYFKCRNCNEIYTEVYRCTTESFRVAINDYKQAMDLHPTHLCQRHPPRIYGVADIQAYEEILPPTAKSVVE